jgi:parallel beta-helix repeat protein
MESRDCQGAVPRIHSDGRVLGKNILTQKPTEACTPRHITSKWRFMGLNRVNQVNHLLLMALILMLPCSILLPTAPSSAQEPIPSPTLSKNNNIIYVNAQAGDDQQSGKKTSPLQTISHALKIAPAGSTIQLAPGTYSEETGETFPLVLEHQITLQGNPRDQGYKTIIQGDGYFLSPTAAGQNVAIAAVKDAGKITGITISNNHSRGHGIWVESANPQIISNTLTRNGNTGVSVNGKSAPLIANNYFYNNSGNGLLVYGTSQPQVTKNTFEQTGFGISLVQNAAAKITDNLFDGNRIGIILEGNSQGTLRHNEIINSGEVGLTAIAESQVDLGTDQEPGNNIFRSNQELDIENASSHEIVAVGTEVRGDTAGEINFERGEFLASNNQAAPDLAPDLAPLPPLPNRGDTNDTALPEAPPKDSSEALLPLLPPLPPRLDEPQSSAAPTTIEPPSPDLPPPPPVIASTTGNKELVFRPSDDAVESADVVPIPYPPTVSSSASTVSSAAQVKYKVLVEVLDDDEADEVRSLYPEAFETILEGQPWLQVGAFSDRDKAKQAEQNLVDLGLATYLLE